MVRRNNMAYRIVVDAGHGGICLTQSNERMTTNLINIGV